MDIKDELIDVGMWNTYVGIEQVNYHVILIIIYDNNNRNNNNNS